MCIGCGAETLTDECCGKPEPVSSSALNALLSGLTPYVETIYEHEQCFLDRFGKGDATDLVEVSFSETQIKIVYILDCGQHVCDSVDVADFVRWLEDS